MNDAHKKTVVELIQADDIPRFNTFISENPELVCSVLLQVCNTRPVRRSFVELLLRSGADPNAKEGRESAPLHGAASFNSVEVA